MKTKETTLEEHVHTEILWEDPRLFRDGNLVRSFRMRSTGNFELIITSPVDTKLCICINLAS